MGNLEQQVKETIEQHQMLKQGRRVIVALSGGADSVCLLALLWELKEELELEIRAVHIHHGLRKGEADRDAAFAKKFCEDYSIPCHMIKVDVRAFAAEHKIAEEEAGRRLRYEMLEKEAGLWEQENEQKGIVRIATAHHSGDQAETILYNLFRGCGLVGVKGIPYVRGRIIRPLLDGGRREILGWLNSRGLPFVEDSTNFSDCYTRNRIRNQVLPLIESQVNQGAAKNILRMGKMAAMADAYLESEASDWTKKHMLVLGERGSCFLGDKELVQEAPIIRCYVIFGILKKMAGSEKDLGWNHVEQVLNLFNRTVGRRVALPYGLSAVREYRGVLIYRGEGDKKRHIQEVPAVKFQSFSYEKDQQFPKNMYTKWFDCDRIKGTPVIRTRQKGDYITLSNGCHKTLRRFMIDEKIPCEERDQILLLADGSHIMWIIGYRISEYYKVGAETKKVLEASLNRVE